MLLLILALSQCYCNIPYKPPSGLSDYIFPSGKQASHPLSKDAIQLLNLATFLGSFPLLIGAPPLNLPACPAAFLLYTLDAGLDTDSWTLDAGMDAGPDAAPDAGLDLGQGSIVTVFICI